MDNKGVRKMKTAKYFLLSTMRHFELIIEPENKKAFLTTIEELKAVAELLPTVEEE